MAVFHSRAGSVLAALLVSATPALADVTPEEVWADLELYFARLGYDVAGAETREGDTLVIRDFTATSDDGDMAATISAPALRMTDLGDGTVALDFSDAMTLRFETENEEGAPVSVRLNYGFDALETTVSGTAEEMRYDYTADAVYLELDEVESEGEVVPPEVADAAIRLTGVTGTSLSQPGSPYTIAQDLTADGMEYALSFTDLETGDSGDISGAAQGFSFDGTLSMPEGVDREDMQALISEGFSFEGQLGSTGASSQFVTTSEGVTSSGESSSEESEVALAFGAKGMSLDAAARGYATSFTTPELPFPITASAAELGTELAVPLTASDAPQPYRLGLTISEVAISELLWSILDPEGLLPRDPATVAVALSGEVINEVDLLDPEAMAALEAPDAEAPGTLESARIERLEIAIAGAELTGSGAFTFDNDDLETFDGFPRPQGAVELMLTGSHALIGRLIELGVITQQDAMGARMMLSMFTVPTGERTLSTEIEVNEQGHVLANGNRIR